MVGLLAQVDVPESWWNSWALLAGATGVLAGFQGLHQRYAHESFRLAYRWWGLLYLLSRGVIPMIVFLIGHDSFGEGVGGPITALALGASTEMLLRTKLFLAQREEDGRVEDLLIGPFNLLRWYQDLFLDQMGPTCVEIRIASARQLVPNDLSFEDLLQRVNNRVHLCSESVRNDVVKIINIQPKPTLTDEQKKDELAHRLRSVLSGRMLRALFAE